MALKLNHALVAGSAILALLVTGCSTKGGGDNAAKTDNQGIKTDFGITDKEISLGAITDASGVLKAYGLAVTHGNQMWADDFNSSGGACGRTVKIEVRDSAYKADKAVPLYAELKDKVAGYLQIFGSASLAALKGSFTSDNAIVTSSTTSSINLDNPELLMTGTSHDIDTINGLAYLQKTGKLVDGDKVGVIAIDSEYGLNALDGAEYYAKKHKLELSSVKLSATESDMSSAVTKMKSSDVKAIVAAVAPKAMGSILTQAQAQGLDIPIMGNGPSFEPQLLGTPAASAMGNYYRSVGMAPYGAEGALAQKIATEYPTKFQDEPSDQVNFGYVEGLVWGAILKKACESKDMTREGLIAASKTIEVDTQGLTPKLDYSTEGVPPSREGYIVVPDASIPGGLKPLESHYMSKEAKEYKAPLQK